jgi:hypothetical protein
MSRIDTSESAKARSIGASIRFRIDPRDVPPDKAARRLHITQAEFDVVLEELIAPGFPRPDPTAGMFDLTVVEVPLDEGGALCKSAGVRPADDRVQPGARKAERQEHIPGRRRPSAGARTPADSMYSDMPHATQG